MRARVARSVWCVCVGALAQMCGMTTTTVSGSTRNRRGKRQNDNAAWPSWETRLKTSDVLHDKCTALYAATTEWVTVNGQTVPLGLHLNDVHGAVQELLAMRFVNQHWQEERSSFGIYPVEDFMLSMLDLAADGRLRRGYRGLLCLVGACALCVVVQPVVLD